MKLIPFILLLIILVSCSSNDFDSDNRDNMGYEYFPLLEVGDLKEYRIEKTTYSNDGNIVLSESFMQREEVVISEGGFGHIAKYQIDISQRENENEEWVFSHSRTVDLNPLQAIVHELDERIIHLSFPISKGKEWDGLVFVDQDQLKDFGGENIEFYKNWEFKITQIEAHFEVFKDIVIVQQANTENDLERRLSKEYYAKNIGLVYKEQMILDTQCTLNCEGMNWTEKAQKGFILKMSLTEYN